MLYCILCPIILWKYTANNSYWKNTGIIFVYINADNLYYNTYNNYKTRHQKLVILNLKIKKLSY